MFDERCKIGFYRELTGYYPQLREKAYEALHESKRYWSNPNCYDDIYEMNSFIKFFRDEVLGEKLDYNYFPAERLCRKKDKLLTKCWHWFNEHDQEVAWAYLTKKYKGRQRDLIFKDTTFQDVFNEFKKDFADRRRQFMENAELAVAQSKKKLAKQNMKPQSHGGVANLLKVLTKTMLSEGASITAIAKVQYAVCIQAGIFIPNDFLVDVVVADGIIQEVKDDA